MARTESRTFQVHPDAAQSQIDLFQKFHWSLLSSQDVKTVDNSLEQRGDSVYSVRKSEHFVKLTFTRELDLPNLAEIKKLEQQYDQLPNPVYPALFPVSIWLWVVGSLVYGIGIIGWIAYFFLMYGPKKAAADALEQQNAKKREAIMHDLQKFS